MKIFSFYLIIFFTGLGSLSFAGSSALMAQANVGGIEILSANQGELLQVLQDHKGVFWFKGQTVLKAGSWKISAENIFYDSQTSSLIAADGAVIENFSDSADDPKKTLLTVKKFHWKIGENKGYWLDVEGQLRGFYIQSSLVQYSAQENLVVSDEIFFTDCDLSQPHYSFSADKFILGKDNQFNALGLRMRVGQTELLYLPAMLQLDISSGIVSQFGYNRRRGTFLQNTYNMSFDAERNSLNLFESAKIMFDWYQLNGSMVALQLLNKNPGLFYTANGGYIYRRQIGLDPQDKNVFTPYILQADGSYQTIASHWGYIDFDAFSYVLKNEELPYWLKIDAKFQHYSHPNIGEEFLRRFEPQNTFSALGRFENFSGDNTKDNLQWSLGVQGQYQRHSLHLLVEKDFFRYYDSYLTRYVQLPHLQFNLEDTLYQPQDSMLGLQFIDYKINGRWQNFRYFDSGVFQKTQSDIIVSNQLLSLWQWGRYVRYLPSAGYSLQQQDIHGDFAASSSELAALSSYHAWLLDHTLRLGSLFYYFEARHLMKRSFAEKKIDVFEHDKSNFTSFKINLDGSYQFNLQASTTRDNRSYFNAFAENRRWQPLQFNARYDLDLLGRPDSPFFIFTQDSTESMFFLRLENIAVYSIQFERWQSNELSFRLEMSRFFSPLISYLREFYLQTSWLQDFENLRRSYMNFAFFTSAQLSKNWAIEIKLESKAEQLNRYSESDPLYRPFYDDLVNSLSLHNEASIRRSLINLRNLNVTLQRDLHKWQFRLQFDIRRSQRYFGAQQANNIAVYYEQNIYLSFQLKTFDSLGLQDAQVIRRNRADEL